MVDRSKVEQAIQTRIVNGDAAGAAEALVRLYGSDVLGRCRTLVRDRVVAEDLAQDVFCRAFSGLRDFRGDASLRTWLFTIVRNVCIDHHRRIAGAAWLHDDASDAEEQPEERPFLVQLMVDRERLERALAVLDEGERVLVVLRFVHGMDHAELATCFGLREGTIRMRLCRALARMRDTLEPGDASRGVRGVRGVRSAVPPRRRLARSRRSERVEGELVLTPPELEPASAASRDAAPHAAASSRVASFRVELRMRDVEGRDGRDAGSVLRSVGSVDDRSGRDRLPPLARTLGILLQGVESKPSVGTLLQSLAPTLAELDRAGEPHAFSKRARRWLGWLFGSGPPAA